jgi:hypothetical protein
MELSLELRAQRLPTGSESVQSPATLQRKRIGSALSAPMFWKTGLQPGLSRLGATPWVVDLGLAPSGSGPRDVGWSCMGRSRRDLLEEHRPSSGDQQRAAIPGVDRQSRSSTGSTLSSDEALNH